MRRPVHKRHAPQPDQKYGNIVVSMFINRIMQEGKKSLATRLIYGALEQAGQTVQKPPMELLQTAIDNASPNMELKSRRVGGANYQVPIEVRPERRLALAIRWIIEAARSGKGKPIQTKLAEEFVNAFNNTGTAIKKKADMHRMAEANRAFAHLAW